MTASVRAAIASISVLSVGMNIVFIRVLNIDRIADASVPAVVLGAWLVVVGGQWAWSQRRLFQIAFATLFVAFMLLTSASVVHASEFRFHLISGRVFEGIGSMRDRVIIVWHELGRLPRQTSNRGLNPTERDPRLELLRYLRACTRPSDRIFVGAYAPQLNYFSERRFAAGQSVFISNFYTSRRDQQLAIDRLLRQSVPIVVVESPRSETETFWSDYPILADFVDEHYEEVAETVPSAYSDMSIFVVRGRLQTGIYGSQGLPCFG